MRLSSNRRILLAPALLIAASILAGCPSPAYVGRRAAPVDVTASVDSGRFPPQVGAYRRGRAIEYQPGMANYSIAYDRFDTDLHHSVTLYFYPREKRMEDQFSREKLAVLRAYRGAKLIDEKRTLVRKNGNSFEVYVATFELEAMFAGREQRISSQLLLVELLDRSFKVRSTAPIAQASAAEASMHDLLAQVDWTH